MLKQRLHRLINFYMVWPLGKDHEQQDLEYKLDMDCWDQ